MSDYDGERYSNIQVWDAVDEVYYRLTWKALAQQREVEIAKLSKWQTICVDLDRCEHGRHEGDVCSSCDGPSKGNLLIGHAPIGHTMDGEHIYSPPRSTRYDPDAWRVGGGRCSVNNGGKCPIGPVR